MPKYDSNGRFIPPHERSDEEKDKLLFTKQQRQFLSGELPKPQKKKNHEESDLQTKITKWLVKDYPQVIFFSDFAAGMYIASPYLRNVRSDQACEGKYLDLTILKPVGIYHGLVIEIKVYNSDLFLVDGKTLKSGHVREQYDMINRLRQLGYAADFAVGEADIKQTIINYFNNEHTNKTIFYSRVKHHP